MFLRHSPTDIHSLEKVVLVWVTGSTILQWLGNVFTQPSLYLTNAYDV